MNDQFDHEIAQSLCDWADHATLRGPAFSDVRRRVRRRRQRHVGAAVTPVMLGAAWLGVRATSGDEDLQSSSDAAPPTAETAIDTTQVESPIAGSTTTSSTIATVDTVPSDQIGLYVCVDASGGSPDSIRECQTTFGGGKSFVAGSLADHSFVMALGPQWDANAAYAAAHVGLDVEPLQPPLLTGVDLVGSEAGVIIVVGAATPPCTLPFTCTATTDPAPDPVQTTTAVDPGLTQVPLFTGLLVPAAEQLVDEVGLTVKITYQDVAYASPNDNRVLTQTPPVGQLVPQGIAVELVVGRALAPATTMPVSSAVVAAEQSHTIVSDDYLYGIAKAYCVKAEDIASYNGWPDGLNHPLNGGDVIKIPPNACAPGTATYTVVSGDYLGLVAVKFDTTVEEIVSANDWTDGAQHPLYTGEVIQIPARAQDDVASTTTSVG